MNKLVTQVMDSLIAEIEAGRNPWRKSWTGGGLPENGITRRTYRGINVLLLMVAGLKGSYASAQWATFKQWGGAGCHVRKGEKGTPIVFYRKVEKDDGTGYPMMRVSWVFNAAQVEGYEPAIKPEPTPDERHAAAMAWFESLNIRMPEGPPAYQPLADIVTMPNASSFDNLDEYWATVFHEFVHWTGHRSRLNREFKSGQAYAHEELVAEIGAAFMNAHFSIDTTKNNAAYLRNWLSGFEDKRGALLKASTLANAAYGFLIKDMGEQEMEEAA